MKHILSIIAAIVKAWLHSKSKAGKEEKLTKEYEDVVRKMEKLSVGSAVWHRLYVRRMSINRKLHHLRPRQ